MRRIKLRFIIPENDEANVVGKLFKLFFESQKNGDNFVISDKKLNMLFSFEGPSERIVEAISELPFSYVEYLAIEDEDSDDSKGDDSRQITMFEYLEELEAKKATNISEEQEKGKTNAISEDQGEKPAGATPKEEPVPAAVDEPKVEKKPTFEDHEKAQGKRSFSRKVEEIDEVGKQFFEEKAREASSFEEFVEILGKFIRINDTYQSFYEALVNAACNADEVSTDAITAYMGNHGTPYSTSKRIGVSEKIKQAFTKVGSNVRFTSFLKEVVKYKDHDFSSSGAETTQKESETEKVEEPKEVEFKLLYKPLVDAVTGNKDLGFSDRVGIVLDRVRTKSDKPFFDMNRDKLIELLVKTAEDIKNGEKFQKAISNKAEVIFSSSSHFAKAFIYQSIKDFCNMIGFTEDSKNEVFFEDLIKLM